MSAGIEPIEGLEYCDACQKEVEGVVAINGTAPDAASRRIQICRGCAIDIALTSSRSSGKPELFGWEVGLRAQRQLALEVKKVLDATTRRMG